MSGVLLLPFFIVGPSGLIDYIKLLLSRGEGDFADATFSEAVLSWPGFFRGLGGEPTPSATILMSAVTLLLFLGVRRRGNRDLRLSASVLTGLLVVPHSHPQDWITLAVVAALLIRDARNGFELSVSCAW